MSTNGRARPDLAINRASTVNCKVAGKVESLYLRHDRAATHLFRVLGRREASGDQRALIASADTPDGPSLGLGERAFDAGEQALAPFEGITDELIASVPVARI